MRRKLILLLLAMNVAGVAFWATHRPGPDARVLPDDQVDRSITYSNVLPADYVGPDRCNDCHAKEHKLWLNHPHRRMNQMASAESVEGDFNDAKLEVPHGVITFTHEGDKYLATVERDGQFLRQYQITRTVGTVYQQYYIAKQVKGPEPLDSPLYKEHMLPFGYWRSLNRWLPKAFLDADGAEHLEHGIATTEGVDYVKDIRLYNEDCMNCHNTYPYVYRVFHRKFSGFPFANVSGALGPLSEALKPNVNVKPDVDSFENVRKLLDPSKDLVTLGISCESCHFGGREHAEEEDDIHFAPTSSMVKVTPVVASRPVKGERTDPESVNGICAQCHSGNSPLYPNGASVANSSEALDFVTGACANKMRCVDCHNPHEKGAPEASPPQAKHLATCVKCHTQFQDATAVATHTRHGPDVTCLDCHMPREVMGLDDIVRTHHISKPVEASMVKANSTNACNLCHLDKSVAWTVAELKKGWNQSISVEGVAPDKLNTPMGDIWLHADQPMRLLATRSWAHSPWAKEKLPELIHELDDQEPINRVYALKSVEYVTGKKLDASTYTLQGSPAEREKQIDALLQSLNARSGL
ncbi:MAG: ammonia-forming cytochrome c nitrite reductase subunit c552 [Deltaproteobacteria bacterium]|nr:ammonia-forming cytochrome c nitrite reductase subunit c552 [Deltaproteobacteria bacterium]